ncbi:MAG: hypothetical protein ACOY0T_32585 [Myxococcota bacterium]
MRHALAWCGGVLVAALLATSGAQAQSPLTPGTPLPPGHPPVAGSAAAPARTPGATSSASPHGPAPATSATALPPGHPETGAQTVAPRNPHAGTPRDESAPASDLPKGTIEAVIVDGESKPIPNADVRLGIMFQKISEGESRSERFQRTNAEGRARFDGLTAASEYSYRVTFKSGAAEYASTPFPLGELGQRVLLHVFPVTQSLENALVGMRSFVYIEPRDDVFVFELLYRVFNVGNVTWVPSNVVVRLPEGFKAFNAQQGMSDVGFEAVPGEGARLKGTFTPGQHDLSARFQVPKGSDASATFRLGTLPRLAELRVIAEASSQMHLEVDGFEPPQVSSNPQGKRVLVTRKLLERGDELANGFTVTLSGLPVPGNGRWVAVLVAAGFVGLGLASARGLLRLDGSGSKTQDLKRARDVLLSELVEVERSKQRGDLGPVAYADARRVLLNALARLGRDTLEPAAARKRRRPRAA